MILEKIPKTSSSNALKDCFSARKKIKCEGKADYRFVCDENLNFGSYQKHIRGSRNKFNTYYGFCSCGISVAQTGPTFTTHCILS